MNKYVGRKVKIDGKTGTVVYADRAGLVVEFEDGSQIMCSKTRVQFV
jgi:hypothetical protein